MNAGCEERKLALRLLALNASDRQWMLSRIEDAPRARMSALLNELDALGFRVDESMLEEVEAKVDSMAPGPRQEPDPARQWIDSIDQADAEHVIAIFSREPPEVRAEVLRMHPWQWRRSVLAHFGLMEPNGDARVQAEQPRQAMLKAFSDLLATQREYSCEGCQDSAGNASVPRRRWFKWRG